MTLHRCFKGRFDVCLRLLKARGLSPYSPFAAFSLPFREIMAVMASRRRGGAEGDDCHLSICRVFL